MSLRRVVSLEVPVQAVLPRGSVQHVNGLVVIPIVPGRFCAPPLQPGRDEQLAGCFGLYQYRPEAFAPGARLELHVYSGGARARRHVWTLPSKLVDLVWSDFEPWRTAAARLPAAASSRDDPMAPPPSALGR